MARKKRRKFPIFLAIIILVIIIFGVMLKWNSGYTQNVSGSTDAYNKFKDAIISGGTVSLSSDDINSFISRSFEGQTHKGVTIKKIYVNMTGDKIDIKIPVSCKGQDFLVSSKGNLVLKDGCLAYLPESFKVGAIPIPKSFVLNKLKAIYSSKFTVQADGMYINKSAMPFTINSVQIKDSNLKIGVEKLKIDLSDNAGKIRDELTNTLKNLNPSDKAKVEDAIKYIENNPNALNDVKNKLSGVSNSEIKNVIDEINSNAGGGSNPSNNSNSNYGTKKLDPELARSLSGELSKASDEITDAKAKELVNEMKAQIDSGNIDSSSIISGAKALNSSQKSQLMNALNDKISPLDMIEVRKLYKIK